MYRRQDTVAKHPVPDATWSFSEEGLASEPVEDRQVGDIHFSPHPSGNGYKHWVLKGGDSPNWVSCAESEPHPSSPYYVLRPERDGNPPRWVKPHSIYEYRRRFKTGSRK